MAARITLLFFLALTTSFCTCVRAQESSDSELQNALMRVFEKGNLMVALSAKDWRTGLAIAATRLDAGQTTSLEVNLSRHQSYAFLATGALETTDVDLFLRDSSGLEIMSDTEEDGTPILEFRVLKSGNYRLQVHVAGAEKPTNYVAVALLETEGNALIENDFRRQTGRFFTAASSLLNATPARRFTDTGGQWPIQGYLLPAGRGMTISQIAVDDEDVVVAATPGPAIKELSLYSGNNQGVITSRTPSATNFPLLGIPVREGERYDLRIESTSHKVSELVLLGTFKESP